MIAIIKLDFQSSDVAKHILDAITPDNTPLPSGLTIECSVKGTELLITIQCERSISSLGATLEDILSAIDLSVRTSQSINSIE
jgi:tRNA threonylcarbamoyladenosine modification (KEOPS) complex  Pcc1 subunit